MPSPLVTIDREGTVFDLSEIERTLRELQVVFTSTNSQRSLREPFDHVTVDHMISGYAFIEALIDSNIELFAFGQLRLFLELNALVLCGHDERVRLDSAQHLAANDKHFFDNADGGIRDVVEWHALHSYNSAWIRAAGVYIRILSEPELFIEGNHRTGALVMSYILARDGHPPFVLTVDRAKEFFDWSMRFSGKRKSSLLLRWQMPWLARNFAEFLMAQANPRFLRACRD